MPDLQELWSGLSEGRDDVVFLCVNIGDEPEVIRSYWEKGGFSLTAVRQQGDVVSRAFGVQAYPTNYVLAPDGSVAWRGVGWDEAAVRATLERLLGLAEAEAGAGPPALPPHDPELYPDADPEALAYLLRFEQRCTEAAALHFTATGELRGPAMRGEMRIECAVARPALGRFVAEAVLHAADAPEGAPPQEKRGVYRGDGKRVQVRLGEDVHEARNWREADVGEGVLPFAAWAGVTGQPRIGVAFAEPDARWPGQVGIRFRAKEGSMHTLWFDADGDWSGLLVEDGVDEAATVLRMEITGFRLEKQIDPEAWRAPGSGEEGAGG